jgi:hypothetical protein
MKRILYVFITVIILAAIILSAAFSVKPHPKPPAKADLAVKRTSERISYTISPLKGTAQYREVGLVQLDGKPAQLVIFETHVGGFKDIEKIYSDPVSFLVLKVDRDVSGWFGREHIIEEYDQSNFTVRISKFKGKKKTEETLLKADGPIYNAIILPFHQRQAVPFSKGWTRTFRIPKKIEVKLSAIEKIEVGGRSYEAYRFSGTPGQFDFWISKNDPHVPLKIKGGGVFKYSLLINGYSRENSQ